MANQNRRDDHFAGGLGLLAAAVYLCVKGLKKVEDRLQKRQKK